MNDDVLVWITAGGTKFHRDPECASLNQGQDDARSRGDRVHAKRAVPLRDAIDRAECLTCAAFVSAEELGADHLRVETQWEQRFRDQILRRVPELSAWTVNSQEELQLGDRLYRPDFTLRHGSQRLVVEIDGKDQGRGAPSHTLWTRRQTALVAAGWQVLRFSNEDVVLSPEDCRVHLAQALARAEENERHLAGRRSAQHVQADATAASAPAKEPSPSRTRSRRRAPTWAVVVGVAAAVVAVVLVAFHMSGSNATAGVDPVDDGRGVGFVICPASHPIKGNVSRGGQKIYHVPGDALYDKTRPERCFASASDANAAGFRPSGR